MKDENYISKQEWHELVTAAEATNSTEGTVLSAIEAIGTNNREEVYHYIGKQKDAIIASLSGYVDLCYKRSFDAGWHTDITTGQLKDRNKGEMLMLIVSEIAEAMEGERKNLNDDHLPHRKMAEVELADAFIRICDYSGRWGYDLEGAVKEKLEYNLNRQDHKVENRLKDGGKSW